MVTHLGFTGTSSGMSLAQASSLASFLALVEEDWIGHHGSCVGSDVQFDAIARLSPRFKAMHLHPASGVGSKRAFCMAASADFLWPEKPPLDRNVDIVRLSKFLIATPKESHMILRSGTWATIRYALNLSIPVHVILPNGAIVLWQNQRSPFGG